jgi:hypothetical protein
MEMARQHIAEAQTLVARQETLIAEMTASHQETKEAEAALYILKNVLRFLHEDLEMLKAKSK